jgi:hypothetical protein
MNVNALYFIFMNSQKPPEEAPKDKFELRRYLENIESKSPSELEAMADEVIGNVFEVMDRYRRLPEGDQLRKYYEPPLRQIELAYSLRDFKDIFPSAIRYLLSSINWE